MNINIVISSFISLTEQFYSTDFKSALCGGVIFPEWQKNSEKAGAGQRRKGLRVVGIGSGQAGRESARGRLYAGLEAPRNADLANGASQRSFGPENGRERGFQS